MTDTPDLRTAAQALITKYDATQMGGELFDIEAEAEALRVALAQSEGEPKRFDGDDLSKARLWGDFWKGKYFEQVRQTTLINKACARHKRALKRLRNQGTVPGTEGSGSGGAESRSAASRVGLEGAAGDKGHVSPSGREDAGGSARMALEPQIVSESSDSPASTADAPAPTEYRTIKLSENKGTVPIEKITEAVRDTPAPTTECPNPLCVDGEVVSGLLGVDHSADGDCVVEGFRHTDGTIEVTSVTSET